MSEATIKCGGCGIALLAVSRTYSRNQSFFALLRTKFCTNFKLKKPSIYRKTCLRLEKNWVKFRQLCEFRQKLGSVTRLHAIAKRFLLLLACYRKNPPHFCRTFQKYSPHYSPNLPHTCRTLSSLSKVQNRTFCEILTGGHVPPVFGTKLLNFLKPAVPSLSYINYDFSLLCSLQMIGYTYMVES